MTRTSPLDPDYAARVRDSYNRQIIMQTIGAALTRVEPGEVDITLTHRSDLTQQHGFVHAGILATIADSSCGYAAFSLMEAGAAVLSIEFKINLLRPASDAVFVARARVIKPGRNIMTCTADVMGMDAINGAAERHVASMMATIMVVKDRVDLAG